jgi:hypothetical protein
MFVAGVCLGSSEWRSRPGKYSSRGGKMGGKMNIGCKKIFYTLKNFKISETHNMKFNK